MAGASKWMVVGALGAWFVTFVRITSFNVFAKNVAHQTRVAYFTACLEKDAAYYDEHPPTEMASKISQEMSSLESGIGDKFSIII